MRTTELRLHKASFARNPSFVGSFVDNAPDKALTPMRHRSRRYRTKPAQPATPCESNAKMNIQRNLTRRHEGAKSQNSALPCACIEKAPQPVIKNSVYNRRCIHSASGILFLIEGLLGFGPHKRASAGLSGLNGDLLALFLFALALAFIPRIGKAAADADKEIDLEVSTPAIERLNERRAKRAERIRQWKRQGLIGEARDGLLAVRSLEDVKLSTKKEIQDYLSAENDDRRAAYREVLSANGLEATEAERVMAAAARKIRENSEKNDWVQDPQTGSWIQSEFGEGREKGTTGGNRNP